MSSNDLPLGASRVGFVFDGLDETPHVAGRLTRSAKNIRLTLPYMRGFNDVHQRWFASHVMWGDDRERTKFRYSPPSELDFSDAHGQVALVGCRDVGMTEQLVSGVGQGQIDVDYAVLDARRARNLRRINGMRSGIEGLGTWMQLRSLRAETETDEEGRIAAVSLHLRSP